MNSTYDGTNKQKTTSVEDISMLEKESPPDYVTFRQKLATSEIDDLRKDFKFSQESLLCSIKDMFSKQDHRLTCMAQDFDEVKKSLHFISEKHVELDKRTLESEKRIAVLESKSSHYDGHGKQILLLETKLDAFEQQVRQNNVEITNLPEKRSENLVTILTTICDKIKLPITTSDILAIHRVPHAKHQESRPKNIIVEFSSKTLRDNFLAAARRSRNITSESLNITGTSHNIYFNEHLTLKNKLIFREAREAARKHGYRFVWPKHGSVLVRADEKSPVFAVRSVEEVLQKIKPRDARPPADKPAWTQLFLLFTYPF